MKREGWLILIAAAVLCAGGLAVWWLGMQPPRGSAIEIGGGGVTIDEHNRPEVRELTEKDSAKELDENLDTYLGSVKRAYGSEARAYLDDGERAKLDIPVPPVEPMERKAPDLLPPPTPEEPTQRPE